MRDEILDKLRADKQALDDYGVKSIGVFGSVARGEAKPEDVDILVDYDSTNHPGLFGFMELREHLEGVLGHKVDLVERDGLHPALRDDILDEVVYA